MGASLPNTHKNKRVKRRQLAEINVTPFVDVMLVLLIIFMVTAPLLTVGIQVDLPKTKAANIQGEDEPLVITLNKEGDIYVQETAMEFVKLAPHIAAISDNNKDLRIFIRADETLDYGLVMRVMGELTAEGFRKIALVTESKK